MFTLPAPDSIDTAAIIFPIFFIWNESNQRRGTERENLSHKSRIRYIARLLKLKKKEYPEARTRDYTRIFISIAYKYKKRTDSSRRLINVRSKGIAKNRGIIKQSR